MNRTEQASEPTMEEILASIRLIISDDVKVAPPEREEQPRRLVTQKAAHQTTHEQSEDVLDLTDSLDTPPIRPAMPAAREERKVAPVVSLRQEKPTEELLPDTNLTEQQEAPDEVVPPHLEEPRRASSASHQALSQAAPVASRTMWSRREIPSPVSSTPPFPAHYEAPAHPQKRWHHDVQMPIPEHGPVSLIPGQDQSNSAEAEDPGAPEGAEIAHGSINPDQDLNQTREAAVAVIAENLARTAAEAMQGNELAAASKIDFSALEKDHKADVAETFANAIRSDAHELPTLLDEVFRQDFMRAPVAEERDPSPDGASKPETSSPPHDDHKELVERLNGFSHPSETPHEAQDAHAVQMLAERSSEASSLPEASRRAQHVEPSAQKQSEAAPSLAEAVVSQEPDPKPAPVKLAPPSLEAMSPPVADVRSGSPLEEAVRDLLRPLLVQWLNENMPRVLENAIRDEIATRGLLSMPEK